MNNLEKQYNFTLPDGKRVSTTSEEAFADQMEVDGYYEDFKDMKQTGVDEIQKGVSELNNPELDQDEYDELKRASLSRLVGHVTVDMFVEQEKSRVDAISDHMGKTQMQFDEAKDEMQAAGKPFVGSETTHESQTSDASTQTGDEKRSFKSRFSRR